MNREWRVSMAKDLARLGGISRPEPGWEARRSWTWYRLDPSSSAQCPKVKIHFPHAALTTSCHGTKTQQWPPGKSAGRGRKGLLSSRTLPAPHCILTLSLHSDSVAALQTPLCIHAGTWA